MEEQHQLKYHGNYSIFEQAQMTAEDRKWTLERIAKELKDREEAERQQMARIPKPRIRKR